MSARLDRQLTQVDGLDEKSGIFFGFSVALVAGAAAIGNDMGMSPPALVFKVLAMVYGLIAAALYFDALRVRDFRDAPSAEAVVEVATGGYRQRQVFDHFTADQLTAIQANRDTIAAKMRSQSRGHYFAIPGVLALIAQTLAMLAQAMGRG